MENESQKTEEELQLLMKEKIMRELRLREERYERERKKEEKEYEEKLAAGLIPRRTIEPDSEEYKRELETWTQGIEIYKKNIKINALQLRKKKLLPERYSQETMPADFFLNSSKSKDVYKVFFHYKDTP